MHCFLLAAVATPSFALTKEEALAQLAQLDVTLEGDKEEIQRILHKLLKEHQGVLDKERCLSVTKKLDDDRTETRKLCLAP